MTAILAIVVLVSFFVIGWTVGAREARLEYEGAMRRWVEIEFSPESILIRHAAVLREKAAECENPRVRRLLEASADSMDRARPQAKGQA
jgi:hypothetical protein